MKRRARRRIVFKPVSIVSLAKFPMVLDIPPEILGIKLSEEEREAIKCTQAIIDKVRAKLKR